MTATPDRTKHKVKSHTPYWQRRYHQVKDEGHSVDYAAGVADIIEERHKAKVKREKGR